MVFSNTVLFQVKWLHVPCGPLISQFTPAVGKISWGAFCDFTVEGELVLNMNGSFMNHRGKKQSWERTDVDTTCPVCLERKRQSEVRRDQPRPRGCWTQVTGRTRAGGRAGGQPGEGLGHIPRLPWRPQATQRSVYARRWCDCACVLEWRVYRREETMGTGRSINSAK